ncbi:MAG TPA: exodeoxyribonuclease VII large subunit [Candidatus Latescibacteria bacterium]|jgi:exodeoxyribonuclease VII large subunit|nr:exodeoxyribonuclease VII large subunit [Gemmatimonadaceae bacterium]MDP6016772.1 exodeoxyribonuclease VII large subunit [Candidatus Latescibacterota bacterium]MDP7339993.1 exodeoxyribonuclease VII large subunit [Vicinamibacterales bacterium]HJP31136.1 exodeoxyribonuclease VII large subunit [Candidatus Latescibacterota bacterium]
MNDAFDAAGLAGPLSVSDITARVKATLEQSMPFCWVEGEISECSRPASGHIYLTLADEYSQLGCVMFRLQAQQLRFQPERGMKVLVYGNVSVYERGGRYQFYVYRIQPSGVGELAVAFEQLRLRLEGEGLFDAERKRPLPTHPRAVGVVTSPTGAAIRDIVQVLGRRTPGLQVVLASARVQGSAAPRDLCRGIDRLNRWGGVDIIIVGRGGGSPEDLWPFNDESVARAIYRSQVPVVAAIGHEIDHSIADYVADVRAPTPSAAAELVAQEYGVLRERVGALRQRLLRTMDQRFDHLQREVDSHDPRRLLTRLQDRVDQQSQRLDETVTQLAAAADGCLCSHRSRFARAAMRLQARSPLSSLTRGFAYCEREADGQPVRSAGDLSAGDHLRLRFASGEARCRVEETRP